MKLMNIVLFLVLLFGNTGTSMAKPTADQTRLFILSEVRALRDQYFNRKPANYSVRFSRSGDKFIVSATRRSRHESVELRRTSEIILTRFESHSQARCRRNRGRIAFSFKCKQGHACVGLRRAGSRGTVVGQLKKFDALPFCDSAANRKRVRRISNAFKHLIKLQGGSAGVTDALGIGAAFD